MIIRDKRDDVFDFNFKTISVYNIDVFDVVDIVAYDIFDVTDKSDNINVEDTVKNKTNEIDEETNMTVKGDEKSFLSLVGFVSLTYFVYTCLCNLMLLEYCSKHCLQTKAFVFF